MDDLNIDEYRKAVDKLAAARSSLLFQNDSISHASIVIEAILRHSKTEIFIYEGQLNGDVSGTSSSFIATLLEAVTEGRKSLKIVAEPPLDGSVSRIAAVLSMLSQSYPGRVEVRRESKEFRKEISKLCKWLEIDGTLHFAVGDRQMIRVEFPAGERKAYCCFNKPEFADRLRAPFEQAFDSCDEYFTPASAVTV